MKGLAVIGAGVRGMALARHAARLGAPIAAVAEPDPGRRSTFLREFPGARGFESWEALGEGLDAAIVATLDNAHVEPVLDCLRRGRHVLLEKPMAHTEEGCRAIAQARRDAGTVLAVCHSLRYLEPYKTLKALLEEGALGRLVHLEHMEAIGHVRYVHNYVRGRWGREEGNTFLLLHKCCHDLDLLQWLAGEPCARVASFGGLTHFRREHAPAGSTERCLDCPLAGGCLHSATRLYLEGDLEAWPARDLRAAHTVEAHREALRTGPYGLCAWRAGNDVVDHQTVLLGFGSGPTATCTLTGYSATNGRRMRLQGTEGELLYDEVAGEAILRRFEGGPARRFPFPPPEAYHPEDAEIVGGWLRTIEHPGAPCIAVDAEEALRSHLVVFAAERARRGGRVVEIKAGS